MAVSAEIQTVQIQIDGVDLAVPKGELIVESAKRLGIEIPIFCYHPRMKPVGMCRMCLVEIGTKQPDGSVRKMPKPQAACTLPASEGLVIYSNTESVHKDRKGVLEFLLINHPLDCPICDRGGECPLQNNTLFYGPSTSRYVELKRHAPKAFPLSDYVTLDLERCIQCGRCVRFTEEISGDGQLAFRFRGAAMQPSTFELSTFDSRFSGNTIEICPVGALTSTKYRFRARPWDLETSPGICLFCSNGCNVWMDHRIGKMVRINGRIHDGINEEWTCDKGKFGHDFYNESGRLSKVFVRKEHQLKESDWPVAFAEILSRFKGAGSSAAMLISGEESNESLHVAKKLMNEVAGSKNIDFRFQKNLDNWPDFTEPLKIADIESEKAIFVFGTALEDSLPIVYLRARKAWFKNGTKVIVATDSPTEVDAFADSVLRFKPGMGSILLSALAGELDLDSASEKCGISKSTIEQARTTCENLQAQILTTSEIFDTAESNLYEALTRLSDAWKSKVSLYGLEANESGARVLVLRGTDRGLNTWEILQACVRGEVKSLWLVGLDPFDKIDNRELVRKALESVEFLVVQNMKTTECLNYASVILPSCGSAEQASTFVNCEGRIQTQDSILRTLGDAKPSWAIFSEVLARSGGSIGYFSSSDVFGEICDQHEMFAGVIHHSGSSNLVASEGAFLNFGNSSVLGNPDDRLESPAGARG